MDPSSTETQQQQQQPPPCNDDDDDGDRGDVNVIPPAKMGPEPTLLSRKEVDALYETLQDIIIALEKLHVDYILTGGSLLGAIRQESILFCDDDIDVTIIEYPPGHPNDPYCNNNNNNSKQNSSSSSYTSPYERVRTNLQELLGTKKYTYSIRPWEAGDRVRPKHINSIFVDIFTLRRFDTIQDLRQVIGIKTNGQPQPQQYVDNLCETITTAASTSPQQGETSLPLCPFWQFNTRKAIELWPKEVYREYELFPLDRNLKFGPFDHGIIGPQMPVLLLQRAFGLDCFDVYYASGSHKDNNKDVVKNGIVLHDDNKASSSNGENNNNTKLPPRTLPGGIWENSPKLPLQDEHYIPIQPTSRQKRRPTNHNRQQLQSYLQHQRETEAIWQREQSIRLGIIDPLDRPRRTIYMDGVFDMFHIGHLEAIQQCAALGDRVIIGVVSDKDARGYKRQPIIPQSQRVAIVRAIRYVDKVICPNPFVITEQFMNEHEIDLVVHGFANKADEERQDEFFKVPRQLNKFRTIRYYNGLSTSDVIEQIQSLGNCK